MMKVRLLVDPGGLPEPKRNYRTKELQNSCCFVELWTKMFDLIWRFSLRFPRFPRQNLEIVTLRLEYMMTELYKRN